MASSSGPTQKVVPAQVDFLAIYNPSLGTTDDTLDDQIVYYSSAQTRKNYELRHKKENSSPELSQNEKNERLRQIGLAQGMVEFGRSFSNGKSIDSVETQKSRIILHELESGWWLLASIDFTQMPLASKPSFIDSKNTAKNGDATVEYSSREVKPPSLLLQDLLRAHSTFLLHHASSMSALFVRTRRSKFVNIIGRYWDSYLSTWNVMLHGNPVVNVYAGIKLAGSGELGMGVGEEHKGSGERAVLEGFVGRVEGLVDLVVSKFGDEDPVEATHQDERGTKASRWLTPNVPWLGTGAEPTSEDGAIFLGVGALSRKSLRDVSHWMEDLYSWGSHAYGVAENPSSTRKSRRKNKSPMPGQGGHISLPEESMDLSSATLIRSKRRLSNPGSSEITVVPEFREPPHIPTNMAAMKPPADLPQKERTLPSREGRPPLNRAPSSQSSTHSASTKSQKGTKITNYFKLGYGTHWTLGSHADKATPDPTAISANRDQPSAEQVESRQTSRPKLPNPIASHDSIYPLNDSMGHFIVGLMGYIDHDGMNEVDDDTTADETTQEDNFRTLLRTVTVELEREGDARAEADISIDLSTDDSKRYESFKTGGSERTGTSAASYESQDRNKTKKLRIVVYANRPFIFTFLFELRTDTLALQSLYRSIHHELAPLQRSLLNSTKQQLSRPNVTTTNVEEGKAPIYDLIWDSKLLTITSSIPNIPDPLQGHDPALRALGWSRIEALNTHMQLLNTYTSTRDDRCELERTCKTSKGWWIVWTRVPDPDVASIMATASISPISGTSTPQVKNEDSGSSQLSPRAFKSPKTKATSATSATSATTSTLDPSLWSGPAHPFLDVSSPLAPVCQDKEIFLIRRASDYVSKFSSTFTGRTSSDDGGWGSGPAKLAQGIGVDTKRYIEGLLNMGQ